MPYYPARRKKNSKNSRKSAKLRKYIPLALILAIAVLFLSGFIIVKNLTKGFASADSYSAFSLKDDDIISLMYVNVEDFASRPIKMTAATFLLIDKSAETMLVYQLPLNYELDVPGKF